MMAGITQKICDVISIVDPQKIKILIMIMVDTPLAF